MASDKRNPLGPVGENVRRNVQRLREQQNLTLAELSRRLNATGRKIPPLGLSRVENGERRVDADDLVALALALDVTPAVLMLPAGDPGEPVPLAEERSAPTWRQAWEWMYGETPLEGVSLQRLSAARPYLKERELIRWLVRSQHRDVELPESDEDWWQSGGEDDDPGMR